jgi:arylsulfatase A-like enzyme
MSSGTGTGKQRPNVVVVLCDQLRSFSVGCWGETFVRTPNIDQFASAGFRFELGVTNSPVCTSARSTLLSSQHARTCVGSRTNEMEPNGTILGRDDRLKFPHTTLAEEFKKLGYRTAQIGKWHVDTRPSRLGFDESLIVRNVYTKGDFIKNESRPYSVPGFTADHEITEIKRFIRDNKARPFFLYYNPHSPHMPLLDVPYKYSRMYDPAKVTLRANVLKNGKLPADERWFQIYMWQTFYNEEFPLVTSKAIPDFTIRNLTALYYGSVSWTDDLFGELVGCLKENDLEEDTIVVFASDHGDMLGSHHRWNKDRVFEEAIRVPIIYGWPGRIKHGVNSNHLTSLMDIMPTLLDLCGGNIPQSVQGRSMSPFLLGTNEEDCLKDNFAFIESPSAELAIRTPTHLYAVTMTEDDSGIESDRYLFYDLRADPYQQHNLIKTNQQAGLAKELQARLVEWDEKTPRLKSLKYTPWGGRPDGWDA